MGLLRPARQSNSYRLYGPVELERMRFITRARTTGFSLAEIREFVRLLGQGKRDCADYAELAHQKLAAIDEQIRVLQATRQELMRVMAACQPLDEGDCQIVAPGRALEA